MKILILGGTGAMGKELVSILSHNNNVYVTSRKQRTSSNENIKYIQGNAHDITFLNEILKNKYDCIVDFMCYSTTEFQDKINLFLDNTNHYIFLSSARVYADAKVITEESNRILDVIDDSLYLKTDEYALAKARQENILFSTNKKNWTIIRPYITYNDNRLQLGFYEKEIWLSRILRGKTLVFPKTLLTKKTTLTYGEDVSYAISKVILKENCYGEVFQVTSDNITDWNNILNQYKDTIKKVCGIDSKIMIIDEKKSEKIISKYYYQYKYDRDYNRVFDGKKLKKFIDEDVKFQDKLNECLEKYLKSYKNEFYIDGKIEGILDRLSNEKTKLSEFIGVKQKIKYILVRYTPYYYFIKNS